MRVFCSACGNRLDPERHICAQCEQQFGSEPRLVLKSDVATYTLLSKLFNVYPVTVSILGLYVLAQLPAAFSRLSMIFTPMGLGVYAFPPISPVNEILRTSIQLVTVLVPIIVITALFDLGIRWVFKRLDHPGLNIRLPKFLGIGYLIGILLIMLANIVPIFMNASATPINRTMGYPINMTDSYRYAQMGGLPTPSPLMSAIGNCEVLSVKLLTWFGGDVNEKDSRGLTPLSLAMGDRPMSRYNFTYSGTHPISSCNDKTRMEIIKTLLDKGAEVNASDNSGTYSTPLRMAIGKRDLGLIKILVEAGADVNNEDEAGNTPVIQAVMLGKADIVQYLISKGADVNHKNHVFRAAINTPARQAGDYPAIVDILLKAGASLDEQDNEGNTVISEAVSMGNLEFLNSLFAKGAHLDRKSGEIALEKAIRNRNIEIINTLIQHGVDVNQTNQHGMPILFQALDSSYEISDALLKAGANPNVKYYSAGINHYRNAMTNYNSYGQNSIYSRMSNPDEGISPVTYAAQHGHYEMIPLLLKYHAKNDLPTQKQM